MARGKNGNAGQGYAPLSYFDRLKIRAATKHLHSRYASVRQAAHKEIDRILKRRQQSRLARLHPKRLARQAWQRANYGKLHKCGNCGHAERDKAMFRQHVSSHMREAGRPRGPQATPGMRERQASARAPEARQQAPARAPDMRRQSGLLPQDRQPEPASRPAGPGKPGSVWDIGGPAAARPDVRDRAERPAAPARSKVVEDNPGRGPFRPPSSAPPLPHETVRAPSPARGKTRLRLPRLRARA